MVRYNGIDGGGNGSKLIKKSSKVEKCQKAKKFAKIIGS